MNSDVDDADDMIDASPLDALAEEFLARYRRGEMPSVEEYITGHPSLADGIGVLFPTLMVLEDARPAGDDVAERPGSIGDSFDGTPTRQLGDYRIIREVGRGGMGIVYEAEQVSLGRRVAVKVLPKHAALNHRQVERFRREARAAAQLHHTNIVSVFGMGEQDEIHYHIMQFIHGHGLDQILAEVSRLRREPKCEDRSPLEWGWLATQSAIHDNRSQRIRLPGGDSSTSESGAWYWQSVARIAIQVAEALAYAAREGVLHRDIKPSNLMLDARGTVWVTDFGLAKANGSDDLTQTGDIVGTLRYMAPERFRGQADQRSDIYSLGITMYELITLQHPFEACDRQELVRHIEREEPPRPRSIDPIVPRDLETIVLKAIAKQPWNRYADADLLADDLRRFLSGQPILARRIGLAERLFRWCYRNPIVAGLIFTVLMLSTALGAAAFVMQIVRRERDLAVVSFNRAAAEEKRAQQNQQLAQRAERRVMIAAHLAQATALRRSGEMGQRFLCLEQLALAAKLDWGGEFRDDLQSEAIASMGLTDLRTERERHLAPIVGLQFDHTLRRCAFVELFAGGETVVRDLDSDQDVLRVANPGFSFWHASADFSDDGRHLLVVYHPTGAATAEAVLHVWLIDSNECVLDRPIRSADVYASVATRRNQLIFVNRGGDLCLWDLEKRREEKRIPISMTPFSICLDAEGRRVAVNDYLTPQVKILDLGSGDQLAAWSAQVGRFAMDWSADGQLLACGDDDGQIYVWHVPRQELVSTLEGQGAIICARFANRGHLLATCGWDNASQLWDASTGRELVRGVGKPLRFSADDQHLAFIRDDSIGTWEVAHQVELRFLFPASLQCAPRTDRATRGARFSPDGRLLATLTPKGIWIWNRSTGEELGFLSCGPTCELLFQDNGEGFVTSTTGGGIDYWPMQWDRSEYREVLSIGPPRALSRDDPNGQDSFASNSIAWLPDQTGLIHPDNAGRRVVVIPFAETGDSKGEVVSLPSEHGRITNVAVSADGRWVAAGGWKERHIQVWDLANRQREALLRQDRNEYPTRFWVQFSPDNRWLISAADTVGYSAYTVGSWQPSTIRSISTNTSVATAFSADGRRFAFNTGPHQVLVTSSDQHELMRLSTNQIAYAIALSDDGRECAVSPERGPLMWWNLHRVSQQLELLGLGLDRGDLTSPLNAAEPSVDSVHSATPTDRWGKPFQDQTEIRLHVDLGPLH